MPTPEQVVAAYERRTVKLYKSALRTQASDIRRIRGVFSRMKSDILRTVPQFYAVEQAAVTSLLADVAGRIDVAMRDLGVALRGGMTAAQELSTEIALLYGQDFAGDLGAVDLMGLDPRDFDIASRFSADLINLNTGGLGARMLGEVNRVVRLAAMGAKGSQFPAVAALNQALGGPRRWTWQAERIYRTEVLRVQSLTMQANIERLNARTPTRKKWIWSGASRLEHARIDGQTVAANRSFVVPTRLGPTVKMRFPRDPSAPPDATINCGCLMVPAPAASTARRTARQAGGSTRTGAPTPARPTAPRKPAGPSLPANVFDRNAYTGERYTRQHFNWLRGEARRMELARDVSDRATVDLGVGGKRRYRKLPIEQSTRILEQSLDEWASLRQRFPNVRGIPGTYYVNGHPTANGTAWMTTVDLERGAFRVGNRVKTQAERLIEARRGTSDGAYKFRWSQGAEEGAGSTFRHEYGHMMDGRVWANDAYASRSAWDTYAQTGTIPPDSVRATAQGWTDILNKYGKAWFEENVSTYSATNGFEAFAETFTMITDRHYIRGTLPADIEAFFDEVLGGSVGGGSEYGTQVLAARIGSKIDDVDRLLAQQKSIAAARETPHFTTVDKIKELEAKKAELLGTLEKTTGFSEQRLALQKIEARIADYEPKIGREYNELLQERTKLLQELADKGA